MIFDTRKEVSLIFYDGHNALEVIEYFTNTNRRKNYGRYLKVNDIGALHYNCRDYPQSEALTLILPNNYITFSYDEDEWWYPVHISVEEFQTYFIEIKV